VDVVVLFANRAPPISSWKLASGSESIFRPDSRWALLLGAVLSSTVGSLHFRGSGRVYSRPKPLRLRVKCARESVWSLRPRAEMSGWLPRRRMAYINWLPPLSFPRRGRILLR